MMDAEGALASPASATSEDDLTESFLDDPANSKSNPGGCSRADQGLAGCGVIIIFVFMGTCSLILTLQGYPFHALLTTTEPSTFITSSNYTQPNFTCPAAVPTSDQNPHEDEHRADDANILHNTTDYLEHFRELPFDAWNPTYTEYKQAMRLWKYALLKSVLSHRMKTHHDDRLFTIYESASGVGLNLLMTMELWAEQLPKNSNITVYGNDYVAESVDISRLILQIGNNMPQKGYSLGQVCRGDSTRLHEWVPAASFDLVYSGYVTPLQDPLELGSSQDHLDDYYEDICTSTDSRKQQQAELLQQLQDDWFALWTIEMLRLTKPGGTVAIEMISYPTCDDLEEWGGVAPTFWVNAIDHYSWPVDPSSLVIEYETHLPGRRYHVRMQKLPVV